MKYTYYGDANLDGRVDGSDYSKIDFGYLSHLTGWANGDFNYDSTVDGSDYTLIDNAFNTQGASLAASIATIFANVIAPAARTALALNAAKTVGQPASRIAKFDKSLMRQNTETVSTFWPTPIESGPTNENAGTNEPGDIAAAVFTLDQSDLWLPLKFSDQPVVLRVLQ